MLALICFSFTLLIGLYFVIIGASLYFYEYDDVRFVCLVLVLIGLSMLAIAFYNAPFTLILEYKKL